MIINKTNIKSFLNITTSEYDNRIDSIIPVILDRISKNCNNLFLYKNYNGFVYDYSDMTITTTTITLTTTISFAVGDWFRLYHTDYNDGLYQVKTIVGNIITIETAKSFKAETVSNGIITLVNFPDEFIEVIANYVHKYYVNGDKLGLAVERIDDYQANFLNKDFISENAAILNSYKNTYPERFVFNDLSYQ